MNSFIASVGEDLRFLCTSPLPPFRDKAHKRRERWRRLAAARIIQEQSRKRRVPVVEYADQRARLDAVATARNLHRHGPLAARDRDRLRSASPAAKLLRHARPF